MIKVIYRSFGLPKSGSKPTEYEDAFWPQWQQQIMVGNELRFAVADGATESSFSRLWARMLTQYYCNFAQVTPIPGSADSSRSIQKLAKAWSKRIFSKSLEWFVLEKVQRGGQATLLGIILRSIDRKVTQQGEWEAFGVGDTCLFQLRDNDLVRTFPLNHSSQFSQYPTLLSTLPATNELIWQAIDNYTVRAQWQVGDDFLLMTDALAVWFLKAIEAGEQPWYTLAEVTTSQCTFETWVAELRLQQAVRNDDVTLIHIHICE